MQKMQQSFDEADRRKQGDQTNQDAVRETVHDAVDVDANNGDGNHERHEHGQDGTDDAQRFDSFEHFFVLSRRDANDVTDSE